MVFAFLIKNPLQDVHLFESAGFFLTKKIDIYFIDQTHGTYPFFPFLIFPYALAHLITNKWPTLPFSFLIKLILIPTIYALGGLIESVSQRQGVSKKEAQKRKILFILNPVVFFTVVFHGQADILLVFFFLLSLHLLQNIKKLASTISSGAFYGLSILTKTWSIIFWPLFIIKFKNLKKFFIHFAATVLPIFLICYAYTRYVGSSFRQVLSAVFGHPGGSVGYWGYSAAINLVSALFKYPQLRHFNQLIFGYSSQILMAVFFFAYLIVVFQRLNFLKSALLIVLMFNIFTPSWGIQHSLWALPFLFLWKTKSGLYYSLLATPYLFFAYLSVSRFSIDLTDLSRLFSLIPWAYSIKIFYETFKTNKE